MTAGETIATVKNDQKDLRLIKRGKHYEIISNGIFLMATYGGESEQKMVVDGLFYLSQHKLSDMKILIGGLGVGYSLVPAISDDRVSQIDVVELEQEIIQWNREYFNQYNGGALDSNKVQIICGDVYDYLAGKLEQSPAENEYDLIILDVDNGPDWLVRPSNSRLYENDGIALAKHKLNDSGYTAIWSATSKSGLKHAMLGQFESVFIKNYPTNDEKGRSYRYPVYFASQQL